MPRIALATAALAAVLPVHAETPLRTQAQALFGVVQGAAPEAIATAEARLGRALFWDTRLSLDGKTACASCHPAADWGADRRAFSTDARGEKTSRQSPTVFNSTGQPALRWLGDRKDAAAQAEGSITGSMGFAKKDEMVGKLRELDYAPAFKAAYADESDPVTPAHYARAIAAYEATLTTPSPFDRYLAGDDSALDAMQQAGLRSFISLGCAGCHNGPLLGGRLFMKFGVKKEYWLETGAAKPDPGRFAVTKNEEDRYVFRVPMLRNVARTAPYFHDASVGSLDRAVRVMAAVQLGVTPDDASVAAIVAFLGSLTGDVPAHYAPPEAAATPAR
jgi:cytochrome c peroxidase